MAEQSQLTQNLTEGLSSLLQKVLGSGLVLNGGLKIDQLSVTTVDKAKEMGLISSGSQSEQHSPQKQNQSSQDDASKEGSQNENGENQKQQQNTQGQVTREEFENLMEEIKYMRSLLQNSGDESSAQKGKSQAKQ